MLCPAELATLVNVLAIAIAEGKTTSQLNLLAVVFTQIADTIATIAVQKEQIEECCENRKCTYETEISDPADV